jgi:hypothetical protein
MPAAAQARSASASRCSRLSGLAARPSAARSASDALAPPSACVPPGCVRLPCRSRWCRRTAGPKAADEPFGSAGKASEFGVGFVEHDRLAGCCRSVRSRMARPSTVCSTWPATSGSGPRRRLGKACRAASSRSMLSAALLSVALPEQRIAASASPVPSPRSRNPMFGANPNVPLYVPLAPSLSECAVISVASRSMHTGSSQSGSRTGGTPPGSVHTPLRAPWPAPGPGG